MLTFLLVSSIVILLVLKNLGAIEAWLLKLGDRWL